MELYNEVRVKQSDAMSKLLVAQQNEVTKLQHWILKKDSSSKIKGRRTEGQSVHHAFLWMSPQIKTQ